MPPPSRQMKLMANPVKQALAVAIAEARSLRRLPRTWLLTTFAIAAGLTAYYVHAHFHATHSYVVSTAGFANPRFLVHFFAVAPLWVILFGVILLAFDWRHRMTLHQVADVLDSRPPSNLALLSGRFVAVLGVATFVLFLTMAIVQALGATAQALGWRTGEPIEPVSLVALVVIDGLPALAVCCAVVLFLSAACSSRTLVLLITTGLLATQYWLLFNAPIRLVPAISLMSSFGNFASDILPGFGDIRVLAQRGLLIVLAGGLLLAAALLLGRPENSPSARRSCLFGTSLLCMVAVFGLVYLVVSSSADMRQRVHWLAAHEEAATVEPADLRHVEGRLRIDPGSSLELNVQMDLTAPSNVPSQALVFAFNPGMEIQGLLVDGRSAKHWHEDGLLRVRLHGSVKPGADFTLAVHASGIPDPRFAYLDSALDPFAESWADSLLPFLGTTASVFDNAYVALVPGTRWLPMPGANLATDPKLRPRDFFTMDLEVDTPSGWYVAAPGRGTRTQSLNRLRFRPKAPLSEVTVVAAPFQRYAAVVHGVETELLFHPAHLRNIEAISYLAEALLKGWQEFLEEASGFDIPYPYDGLSIVEVPAQLRVYGGGRRMGSIQSSAGVLLMRELGFPTANLHMFPLPDAVPEYMQRQVVTNYFLRDRTGANLLVGAADHLLPLLTGGRGDSADVAELLLGRLTRGLFGFRQSPFTAHSFTEGTLYDATPTTETHLSRAWAALFGGIAVRVARAGEWDSDHPSLWEHATSSAVADLDGENEPHRVWATKALKSNAVARVLMDSLGREDIGKLLATLRSRHTGNTFTMEHLEEIVGQASTRLAPIIGAWLHSRSAPGFVASPARIRILADQSEHARFHVDVRVRNAEPVAGVVRLSLGSDAGDGRVALRSELSETVVVPGNSSVQIGMLSAAPPLTVWLWSYLSLNRTDMRLVTASEAQINGTDQPFVGVRATSWRPAPEAGIVVDDLDEGFVIEPTPAQSLVQSLATAFSREREVANHLDQGLPTYRTLARSGSEAPPRWFRQELGTAWGAYRRTIARTASGGDLKRATFAARIPDAGAWHLEYHLPDLSYQPRVRSFTQSPEVGGVWRGGSLGTYHLSLAGHAEELSIEFDAGRAIPGWNRVGTFDVEAGEVRLHVSNRSSGETVIADAIRWRRVETPTSLSLGAPVRSLSADDQRKKRKPEK